MIRMRRYIGIYMQLLRLNLAVLLTYRVNFINNMIASIGWGAMSLYTVIVLTTHVTKAYGWTRQELLLLNGIYGVIVGVFHMFLSINMGRMSRVIHMGDLDSILIKPIDSQFAISLWQVNFSSVFRILMALGYTIWVIHSMPVTVTVFSILSVVGLAVISIMLLYSLWFLILTNLIWFTNMSNLVSFMYSFESMARFPKEMLTQLASLLFFVVFPLTLVINTPARALLYKATPTDVMVLAGLSLFLWVAARKYWLFALRHYTSASS